MPLLRSILVVVMFSGVIPAAAGQVPNPAAPAGVLRAPLIPTYFDVSPPVRLMGASAAAMAGPPGESLLDTPPSPTVDGLVSHDRDPVVQSVAGVTAMPSLLASFNTINGLGPIPPSPTADVGANHYVVMSNLRYAVYDKSGALLAGPFNNNVLWAGFGGACEMQNSGNPLVVYDQISDRWLLAQFTTTGPTHYMCIAVSMTGDPTGSFYRWAYTIPDGNFPDAPKFTLWPDAFYLATREFDTVNDPFVGVGAYAFNRDDMIAGDPAPRVIAMLIPPIAAPYLVGDGLLAADLDGTRWPPAGSPAYFVGTMDLGGPYGASQDAVTVWRFHADFDVPANSTFTLASTLPVATFDSIFPCPGGGRDCLPQPGAASTQFLDILSYRQRPLHRVTYRNFGTHQVVLACQSVEAGMGPSGPVAGMRWYELRDPGGAPFVYQQGTYAPGITDGIHRWNGDLAMDASGNIAMGFNVTDATTTFPGIRYTGRLAGDPLGQMAQGEATQTNGGGIQSSTGSRWGDYSSMNIDPADDCTFYYLNQYYPITSTTGWMLHTGAFRFPGCVQVSVENEGTLPGSTRLLPVPAVRGRSVDVRFTLAGAEARRVQLEIYDVTGRRVRRLMDEARTGGQYRVTWNRTTDAGATVRPGVYHVRLRAGNTNDAQGAVVLQ